MVGLKINANKKLEFQNVLSTTRRWEHFRKKPCCASKQKTKMSLGYCRVSILFYSCFFENTFPDHKEKSLPGCSICDHNIFQA